MEPFDWQKLPLPRNLEEHELLMGHIGNLEGEEWIQWMRGYALADLHFMVAEVLSTRDYPKSAFTFERCRDIMGAEHDVLDIWSREHLKSSIKTFGRNIQRVARDRNTTVGILSHTRPAAKKFLRRIKVELEDNPLLPVLFPDVFYEHPAKDSKKWSEDDGLLVQRSINVNESTFEAHGFVEGLPTGSHFLVLNYDDIITEKHVGSPDMIEKTTEQWKLSLSLGLRGGIRTYAGTFYDPTDTYNHIADKDSIQLRVIPCWDSDRNPVFYPAEYLLEKLDQMGPRVFGIQWECDPMSGQSTKFSAANLRYYGVNPEDLAQRCRIVILVDPAGEKKKGSDFTVMWVIGLGPDQVFYVLDIVRDRLDPLERLNTLFELVYKWGPHDVQVRYEHYGMQSDVFYIEREMDRRMCHFELIPVGGQAGKEDRINSRVGVMLLQHQLYLPMQLIRPCRWKGGGMVDMIRVFVEEEVRRWPLPYHDDMLDSLSRLLEPDLLLPWPSPTYTRRKDRWDQLFENAREGRATPDDWQLACLGT